MNHLQRTIVIALVVLSSIFAQQANEKLRVVVLTDMSNEPDDQESLVRFLTYANEFDVEGIIATTSVWKKNNPDVQTIRNVINAYGQVHGNLLLHDSRYPTAAHLLSITKSGVNGFGMSAASSQLDNEGINHIISVVDKNDSRPVWFLSWGGSNTLGGAVMKIKNTRSAAAAEAFVAKIRGYEIAIQDDGQAYIAHHFPNSKLIASRDQWKAITHNTFYSGSAGGSSTVFTSSWISENVQNNHGALGASYPNLAVIYEGDTPSFLYLIPNGLNAPEYPSYGGWGGRFLPNKIKNITSGTHSSVDGLTADDRDFYMYSDASDTWSYGSTTYTNNIYAPLFRWREAYQADFQARMDWCIKPYSGANHAPKAVFSGALTQTVGSGQLIQLSAQGSTDPDGNSLAYQWTYYKEAGNFNGGLSITNGSASIASFTTPIVTAPVDIHIILSVKDNGVPALTNYQRIIYTVVPGVQSSSSIIVSSSSSNIPVSSSSSLNSFHIRSGTVLEAENSVLSTGNGTKPSGVVAFNDVGEYFYFNQVSIDDQVTALELTYGVPSPYHGHIVEARLDSPLGTVIGSLTLQSTASWETMRTDRMIITPWSGVQDLYFVFKQGTGENSWVGDFDKLTFLTDSPTLIKNGPRYPLNYRTIMNRFDLLGRIFNKDIL